MSGLLQISLLSVVLMACVVDCAKQLPCNNQTIDEIDRIIAKINPIGNADVEFPETIPDAKKHCK